MTPAQRELLRRAALAAGISLPTFILDAACRTAGQASANRKPDPLATNVESLPTFTRPARQRWESIPADIRQRLLSNVWCGHCGHEVAITDFSGTMKGGDLLLVGHCAECQGEVARVIEGA